MAVVMVVLNIKHLIFIWWYFLDQNHFGGEVFTASQPTTPLLVNFNKDCSSLSVHDNNLFIGSKEGLFQLNTVNKSLRCVIPDRPISGVASNSFTTVYSDAARGHVATVTSVRKRD